MNMNTTASPSTLTTTVRAVKQQVRTLQSGGDAVHVEAFGSIALISPRRQAAFECGSAPEHEHCTVDMPGHQHMKPAGDLPAQCVPREHTHHMVPDEHACCMLPEEFPVSLYIDVPVGSGLALPLGDTLTVTISR